MHEDAEPTDAEPWTARRFEHIDWSELGSRSPSAGVRAAGRFVYSQIVEQWCTAEPDPPRRDALQQLYGLLLLQPAWEPNDCGLLPREILNTIPRDALAALVEHLPDIMNAELRARIADAAWIRRACPAQVAMNAVDDYLVVAQDLYDPEHWVESFLFLQRAVHLGASLGRRGEPFARASTAALDMVRRTAAGERLYFTHRVIEMLRSLSIGDAVELAALGSVRFLIKPCTGADSGG